MTLKDQMYGMAWNNPYNLYAPLSGKNTPSESLGYFVGWQAFTAGTYVAGYAIVGAEASFVSAYAMPFALGGTAALVYTFGAATAIALAYHVHTDPRAEAALSSGLKISNTSNRDIMRMMTLGSVT